MHLKLLLLPHNTLTNHLVQYHYCALLALGGIPEDYHVHLKFATGHYFQIQPLLILCLLFGSLRNLYVIRNYNPAFQLVYSLLVDKRNIFT